MRTNEYLALLYVQSQDLREKNPGDLLVLYRAALDKINRKEDELIQTRGQLGRPEGDAPRWARN